MGRRPKLGPGSSELVGKSAKLRYRPDLVGLDPGPKARRLKAEKQLGQLEALGNRVLRQLDRAAKPKPGPKPPKG